MYQVLLTIFLLIAIGLVLLIMLQHKGADMGASFGVSVSNTLFGSSNSGNFMTRITALLATLFFILSLILGNLNSSNNNHNQEKDQFNNWNHQMQHTSKAPFKTSVVKPGNDIPQ